MRLATSRSSGGRATSSSTPTASRSVNEGVSGDDWSYGFSARLSRTTSTHAQFALREIQENFDPALGFVQRDNVRLLRAAASYNPRPEELPEHPADVPRRLLHALHAARQRRGRELGPLRHAARLALQVGRQPPRHPRLQPDLRAAVRAVRDLAGRDPAAGRVPLHALPEQPRCRRPPSAGCRAAST